MDLPCIPVEDGLLLDVKVIPRSSKREIAGVADRVVRVKLTAPPVGGAANEQLIELLAEVYGVKKSAIMIVKGASSSRKTIKITGR